MFYKDLSENVKHIRNIHFRLTLLCFAFLIVIVTNSSSKEIGKAIKELEIITSIIKEDNWSRFKNKLLSEPDNFYKYNYNNKNRILALNTNDFYEVEFFHPVKFSEYSKPFHKINMRILGQQPYLFSKYNHKIIDKISDYGLPSTLDNFKNIWNTLINAEQNQIATSTKENIYYASLHNSPRTRNIGVNQLIILKIKKINKINQNKIHPIYYRGKSYMHLHSDYVEKGDYHHFTFYYSPYSKQFRKSHFRKWELEEGVYKERELKEIDLGYINWNKTLLKIRQDLNLYFDIIDTSGRDIISNSFDFNLYALIKKIDWHPINLLIQSDLNLNTDLQFENAFSSLFNQTRNNKSISIKDAELLLKDKKKITSEKIEIFGISLPADIISLWGVLIILFIQFYMLLHLIGLVKIVTSNNSYTYVPWIGNYKNKLSRVTTIATTCLLPFLVILYLRFNTMNSIVTPLVLLFSLVISVFILVKMIDYWQKIN